MTVELPQPQRERWQPLRGGLLNVYRYDYEEFRYEQGHLVLRGNNGTGKSRVLALQLPFLLDGEVSPYRLEPDQDSAKRIEWNLLLDKHEERLGYTFIEFGRRDEAGDHFVTLGCGLHAVAGRGLVAKWLFVTPKRVGVDLFLQSAAGHAIGCKQLEEQLGAPCHTSAEAHREAVDAALFGLGRRRYDALIDLLIQLRQPQLSRHLDEKRLSKALSEALPPLPKNIIADVAESFRSLEAERTALEGFSASVSALDRFIDEYARYLQVAVRRRAQAVRSAHAAYEETTRKLRAAEAARETATGRLASLEQRKTKNQLAEAALRAEVGTLEDSPEMRDAKALASLRAEAADWKDRAGRSAEDHARAVDEHKQRMQKRERAADAASDARGVVELKANSASEAAVRATLTAAWRSAADALKLPDGPDDLGTLHRTERRLDEEIARRRKGVDHVAALARAVERAAQTLRAAKEEQTRIVSEHDDAFEERHRRFAAVKQASLALVAAARAFLDGLVELRLPDDRAELEARLASYCETLSGTNPLVEAMRRAYELTVATLAAAQEQHRTKMTGLDEEIAALAGEAERLRRGGDEPPPAPYTRAADARVGRPGAPLWRLCDFDQGLDDSARAGIEAALEAAGLLDAWVTPDGQLLSEGGHDSQLVAGESAPEHSVLDRWLVPDESPTTPVAPDVVRRVLAGIGAGPNAGSTWVHVDGRFQNGPVHGKYGKPAATYVGSTARERWRLARLEEISRALHRLGENRAALVQSIEAITRRIDDAGREAAAMPADDVVRQAHALHAAAVEALVRAQRRVVVAGERVVAADRALADATSARDLAAGDLGLADHVHDLDALQRRIGEFAVAASGIFPVVKAHRKALADAEQAAAEVERAAEEVGRRERVSAEAATKAAELAARRDALEATVGARVEDVLWRLEGARHRLKDNAKERDTLANDKEEAAVARRGAEIDMETQTRRRAEDENRRDEAVLAFKRQAMAGVFSVCDARLGDIDATAWSTTAAVDAARRVEAALTRTASDDEIWRRVQGAIHGHFQGLTEALLKQDHSPTATLEDDLFLVSIPFRGRPCGVAELRAALQDEIDHRGAILSAREREILENHLVGDISMHLHELIRNGERWVEGVNAELQSRPTSTGMTLRFDWRALDDAPAGFSEARKRLLRASGTWSQEERDALGAFLQQQIGAARAANPAASWHDHLSAALDYRAWHQFILERQQDGVWKRLTRRTHGTGSSGEKALALTVPQFAAAAAHYRSADVRAPRLILLDEVFVGIDNDMRAKCMGLLDAFDLDFVMTSEREWACYPTLPGVAIYQLATRPGIDAVYVTRWVWNGRQRVRSEQNLPSPAPPRAA